jgi:anti-sigma28 factor (negative regulator of flagellin synthesis)
MRIDDLNRTPLAQGAEKTDQAADGRALEKSNSSIAGGSDQADVSQLAQSLLSRDPARLEQLRLDVQSGKYEVSAETLANSIIDAHMSE